MKGLTDLQQLVLDTLAESRLTPEGALRWQAKYIGTGSFTTRLSWLHRKRYPDRRNRPQHRHVEAALKKLIAVGLIEHREGESDDYYRLTEAGVEAAS